MNTENKNQKNLIIGLLTCLFIRLIPFRAPNVEPILATQMPFAKKYGAFTGFIFGVLSIIFYDLLTGTAGPWTLFTATAYGLLGFLAALFFKKRSASRKNFVSFAVLGTLFYDAITGLTVGPLFFHQSFMIALVGQIPFTALHLVGNVTFALLISPAVYSFLIKNQKLKPVAEINSSLIKPLTT